MQTLNISQIFSHLSFYQENYLQILQCPSQYYVEVKDAYIDVWPFSRHQLYLGDLLQLWLSDKWLLSTQAETLLDVIENKPQSSTHRYVFQINGRAFSTAHTSKAWLKEQNKEINLCVDSALKYYFIYKALSRPKQNSQNLSLIKSSI